MRLYSVRIRKTIFIMENNKEYFERLVRSHKDTIYTFCGAIVGAVIGGAIGIYHLIQSRRRLNRILKQIEEIKSGE